MEPQVSKADEVVAEIAARSHGVVTRARLLGAGLTPAKIRHRIECGALIAVHRGVYRVGHAAPNTDATYLAAVWACGEPAALGGLSAAWQYGMVRGLAPRPEVLTPSIHRVPGVASRRVRLRRLDLCAFRSIPTLTVPATLVDIAAQLPIDELARACHEAGVRYRTTPRHVDAVLARRPNAKGAANLRAVMSGEARVSLSRLEGRFLELLREHGLPLPLTNRPAGGRRVDCRWPGQRLTVELDSYGFHNSRHSWEQDHRREREAYARGDQLRRYTWGDVFEQPAAMLGELRAVLGST